VNSDASSNSLSRLGGSEWDLLRNTLAEPEQELIAVEVESAAQAQDVVDAIGQLWPERSVRTVHFRPAEEQAGEMVERLQTQSEEDSAVQDPLLLAIAERGEAGSEIDFWKGLNLSRELLAALPGQVVLILLPDSYKAFTKHADHLKRWVTKKIRLRFDAQGDDSATVSGTLPVSYGLMEPQRARKLLHALERQLAKASSQGKTGAQLVNPFYVRMFAAAVSIGDLQRAANILSKIELGGGAKDDDDFLTLKVEYAIKCHDLELANRLANELLQRSELDERRSANIYHQLGMVAQKRRDFEQAENWHLKSLAIDEKQGNEHGVATSYFQLGRIAEERRDFEQAEKWYLKSLAIKEKQGNEHGAAISYHQLGIIAEEGDDFEIAGSRFLSAVQNLAKTGDPRRASIARRSLGRLIARSPDRLAKELEQQARESLSENEFSKLDTLLTEMRDSEVG